MWKRLMFGFVQKRRPSPLEKDKRMRPRMILYHGNEVFHYNINLMNSEQSVQVSDTIQELKRFTKAGQHEKISR